ncbi:excinuclease ABC subunit UvrC [Lachnospira multipara]|uniref:excinuclease ABC subunit UvrC n=1 Tax=Lachnospira multipara TaxID=28051 RepID=UPI0003FFBDE0|nr:excinuclease ABC subunit UvrC [Lachnospira multipara]
MFDLEEELKKLPAKPGVYIMHDKFDNIIYVGKAKILKNRVRQYFQSHRNHSPKIIQMVSRVAYFEYIITDSELEALVLENNLIKEHRPKYNTMLKDDKTYPFIKITVNEAFPRVLFSRTMKHGTGKYFGPYTSSAAVKDTIELLTKLYKVRTCNRKLPADIGKERPCLNYHIGQCDAPCQGYISMEEYHKRIDDVISFLNGNYSDIMDSLNEKMLKASENLEFEEAARYRDLLNSVKQVAQKQKITADDPTDRDVIACASNGEDAVVQIFFIREGKLLGREHFHMRVATGDTRADIILNFIKQYYGGTPYIPNIIMLQEEIEELDIITEWLSGLKQRKVSLITPKKGDKEKMVELAYKNAQMVLNQDTEKIKLEEKRTIGAMKEIESWLHLKNLKRVEAYDISNTSGVESVGSMIVFENGKPKKNDYRKFKIRTVKGPNDYESMREVLTRRFNRALAEIDGSEESRGFSKLPDIIMMDGGRGQVNIALEVLDSLGLNIPVAGMVKDDTHSTRGLYYNNVEIPINKHSEGFKLITRVQDEAHRFAITYHRSLRGKYEVKSVLDDIKGIGPVKRKALMKAFLDIDKIRNASIPELMEVDGITLELAENIYSFFH